MIVLQLIFMFFFFQAEDGIRDTSVTGVQTCALPISRHVSSSARSRNVSGTVSRTRTPVTRATASFSVSRCWMFTAVMTRSEERRVGKEGRTAGAPYLDEQ